MAACADAVVAGAQEAAAILPPSERLLRWALAQGADPARIRLVPPGLDPRAPR